MNTGIILLNLGTPDNADLDSVKRYLKEFLSDPFVIDINPVARWLLVNALIVPFRSPKTLEAYLKIWTVDGSPLLIHLNDLRKKVGQQLGAGFIVESAMRYGKPTIENALLSLKSKHVDRIVVMMLYPQFALSSSQSSIEEIKTTAKRLKLGLPLDFVPPFYDHPSFIDAFAVCGQTSIDQIKPDHVLFSFHGLPIRHIKKTECQPNFCLATRGCCDRIQQANANCYRAQCFSTARHLAQTLKISDENYSVSFQSRLGRTPWIQPFTDEVIGELREKGVKRLVVFCPSFVADCLETLEEINIRLRSSFIEMGGEAFDLVTCPNAEPVWAKGVSQIIKDHLNNINPTL